MLHWGTSTIVALWIKKEFGIPELPLQPANKNDKQDMSFRLNFSLSKKAITKKTQPIPIPEFRKTRFYAGGADEIFASIQKDLQEEQDQEKKYEAETYHFGSNIHT